MLERDTSASTSAMVCIPQTTLSVCQSISLMDISTCGSPQSAGAFAIPTGVSLNGAWPTIFSKPAPNRVGKFFANFCPQELEDIYQGSSLSREQPKAEGNDGKRKAIEGDCPICFMEFEPANEEIVWCRAACGNNIHKICFDQWAATQRAQGVRCVYW